MKRLYEIDNLIDSSDCTIGDIDEWFEELLNNGDVELNEKPMDVINALGGPGSPDRVGEILSQMGVLPEGEDWDDAWGNGTIDDEQIQAAFQRAWDEASDDEKRNAYENCASNEYDDDPDLTDQYREDNGLNEATIKFQSLMERMNKVQKNGSILL